MKQLLVIILSLSLFTANAQTHTYISSSGEMIFSFAKIKSAGADKSSNLRWSPVFNGQSLVNIDITQHFGIFGGLAYRNVGFIYEPTSDTLKKFRTYNLGIPVGIKIGNLKGTFLFGGYEFEIPFAYKEKTFVNDDKKTVETAWFSPKVNPYTQALFAGINFKRGMSVKFKYYIDNFFNSGYSEKSGFVNIKPYANFTANVFYISLSWNAFKDLKSYEKKKYHFKKKSAVETAL